MVTIKGFKGFRYSDKVKAQDVIMPPYDVVDKDQKEELMSKEFNFCHLNLNEHDEARKLFQKWIADGVLVQDDESLYVYQQEFDLDGQTIVRTGFVGALKLEELGEGVLPHEQVFDKIVDERYDLMKNVEANFGQLFMLYEDKEKKIDSILDKVVVENEMKLEYVDDMQCKHRLWQIDDSELISEISGLMTDKKVMIADGHHRYTTSLRYMKENPDVVGNDFVMVTLVNSYNEGLLIFPTNRVIKDVEVDFDKVEEYFDIHNVDGEFELKLGHTGILHKGKKYEISLNEKGRKMAKDIIDHDLVGIDVVILHKFLFDFVLHVPEEKLKVPNFKFVKGDEKTLDLCDDEHTGFFVNPPTVDDVFRVSLKRKIMAQKVTYFYPKLFAGLVVRKFE